MSVGDLVRYASSSVEYRVTALSADGRLADLQQAHRRWKVRRMVATSRLVRLGR